MVLKSKRIAFIFSIFCFIFFGCLTDSPETSGNETYLPLNDSEYPYAQVPRLVLETKDFQEIRDTKTQHQAKLQIYGARAPASEIYSLSLRGRGNSSFEMSQFGYKLKFSEKISLLHFPESRHFALIPMYSDKTLLKNFWTYRLAQNLGVFYAPRTEIVEVFLNRKYLGAYLLTETIRVAESRVNIPKTEYSYLLEIDRKAKPEDCTVQTKSGVVIRIHSPENPSQNALDTLQNFLNQFETLLESDSFSKVLENHLQKDAYFSEYWIQELAQNVDAFQTSSYFTWQKNKPIVFGPVWDFDIAYADGTIETRDGIIGFCARNRKWNARLFADSTFLKEANLWWQAHYPVFLSMSDSVKIYAEHLTAIAKNHFKRWPILQSTEHWTHHTDYNSYTDAVTLFEKRLQERIRWLNEQTK